MKEVSLPQEVGKPTNQHSMLKSFTHCT